MAQARITKRLVDAAASGAKDQFVWDDELRGFGLKITPAGNKVYLIQYRMGGRGSPTCRFTIGGHGSPWTPSTARDEAERLLRLVRQGVNPIDARAEMERKRRADAELGFDAYAKKFLKEYVEPEWARSYDFAESTLRLHVTPVLKSKPLPSISKSDLNSVFDRVAANKVALRRNVFAVVRRLFRWALARGDIERNPLEGSESPARAKKRDRVLKDWELRLAWLGAEELGYPFRELYQLLILTGQRREEVGGLDWKELNRAGADWNLPADRAKNGIAAHVHLSPAAIVLLDRIADVDPKKPKWPRRGLVFTTTGKTAVSGYSRAKLRLDREMLDIARKEAKKRDEDPDSVVLDPWRVHDLRRTLATGCQRLGVRFEVTEAILNHLSGAKSGVAGIYQRHDWKDEKRAALDAWSLHVDRAVNGTEDTNVVSLAERRA